MPGTIVNRSQAAALFLALLLAGCVDAPPTTPSQTEIASQSLGLGDSVAPPAQPDWWKAFSDPQLDRLVPQLLASNPSLQGALARIRAAQADGTVPSGVDANDTARLLLGVLLGIRVLARSTPNRSLLEGVLRPALALLDLPLHKSKTR